MKSYSLRLIVGILTFLIGVGAVSAYFIHRSSSKPVFSRALEEDNITEVVFLHHIEESQKDESQMLYFLSRGENIDLSDDFMLRFNSQPFSVRRVSQSVKVEDGVEDKETKERGLILSIHRIEWVSNSEVQVGLSEHAWAWGLAGYSCRVVLENGKWSIKGCEQTFVT